MFNHHTLRSAIGLLRLSRLGVLAVLVGHLLACVGVVFLMPGGWPLSSLLLWSYRILPSIIAIGILLVIVDRPRRWSVDVAVLAAINGAWIGLLIGTPLLFHSSWLRLALVSVAGVFVTSLALTNHVSLSSRPNRMLRLSFGVVGLMISFASLETIRSPRSSTHPDAAADDADPLASGDAERRNIQLDSNVCFDTTGATITVASGRHVMYVEPLLTFDQRSPDACWTLFSSRQDRVPPMRQLVSTVRMADRVKADYVDVDASKSIASHRLSVSRLDDSYDIRATSRLPRDVYSHLNHITQLTIGGHRKLRVRFSPAPEKAIDVLFADYPVGAPARFAYVDSAGMFKVVQASSAEKGPFTTLAEGPLRNGALTMTFFDGDDPLFEVRLDDWAKQASRELSPAAGWGVPQNAIEFGLDSNSPKSAATFFITLAGTSVGRGWATVGHRAGVYRNCITLKEFPSRISP